jgi:probable rRNA maturation factor
LTVTASAGKTYARRLAGMLRKARPLAGGRVRELSVAIVGDRKMAELHEAFMGIAGPTDVLTFELDHDFGGKVVAGEVIVNVQEATRRARAHDVAVADELLLYAVHGLLHLSGYDDTTKMAYAKMHRKEDQILTQLGIGRVFARGPVAWPVQKGRR